MGNLPPDPLPLLEDPDVGAVIDYIRRVDDRDHLMSLHDAEIHDIEDGPREDVIGAIYTRRAELDGDVVDDDQDDVDEDSSSGPQVTADLYDNDDRPWRSPMLERGVLWRPESERG